MKLTDNDIREIIARAEELQQSGSTPGMEAETLIRVGEDVGISRHAMQRALKERLESHFQPVVGDLVFASSTDGRFYAAEVLAQGEHTHTVRFLQGGERKVASDGLQPPPLLPGDRVMCPWPGWGDAPGTVVSYNSEEQNITVSDGWHQTQVPVRNVWVASPSLARDRRGRIYAAIFVAGVAVGSAIGAMIMAFV